MPDVPVPSRPSTLKRIAVTAMLLLGAAAAFPGVAVAASGFAPGRLVLDQAAASRTAPAAPRPEVSATPRIVGGTALKSNASAAYTVALQIRFGPQTFAGCSGTVLDASHVLTAGHCFVRDGKTAAAADVRIGVGSHRIDTAAGQRETTVVTASAIRVHPRYDGKQFADDVAVVTLSAPLELASGRVATLPMVPVGTYLRPGTAVRVTGFGISGSSKSDFGTLRSVRTKSQTAGLCGTDSPAVMLCTFRKGHAACEGDSGGTAAVGGAARQLVGVTDIAIRDCAAGLNLFANVAAPEIRSFIDAAVAEQTLTKEQIAVAPRGGLQIKVTGTPRVGRTLTCRRGAWSGAPTFRYAFVRVRGTREQDQKLGTKRTYRVRSSDLGWRFGCAVEATNAAGTGVSATRRLRPAVR